MFSEQIYFTKQQTVLFICSQKGERGENGLVGQYGLNGEKGDIGEPGYEGIPGKIVININLYEVSLQNINVYYVIL